MYLKFGGQLCQQQCALDQQQVQQSFTSGQAPTSFELQSKEITESTVSDYNLIT
jgi:hypothetical protein